MMTKQEHLILKLRQEVFNDIVSNPQTGVARDSDSGEVVIPHRNGAAVSDYQKLPPTKFSYSLVDNRIIGLSENERIIGRARAELVYQAKLESLTKQYPNRDGYVAIAPETGETVTGRSETEAFDNFKKTFGFKYMIVRGIGFQRRV